MRLEEFAIAGALGSGATARVFEATHIATGLPVAIKMLEPSLRAKDELARRLEREAQVLRGVVSPHVGKLVGIGWEEGQPFLVLERLRGTTLAELLKRDGRVPVRTLADWLEQLLLGVRDIHAAGVIHRDIKPANIYLVEHGPDTIVKLIDFGVARLREIALDGCSLTSTHHLIGSMGYMAPEQLEYAKGVGPEADLYAVGVVLFRCLAGRLPFVGRSFEALHRLKVETDAPGLSTVLSASVPEVLETFVARALARDPVTRFRTAREMLEAWWRVAAAVESVPVRADGDAGDADDYDVEVEDESTVIEYDATTNRNTLTTRAGTEVYETVTATQPREAAPDSTRAP